MIVVEWTVGCATVAVSAAQISTQFGRPISTTAWDRMRRSRRTLNGECERARLAHILDLLAEDSRLNVYGPELEVRPPGAPTIHLADRRSVMLPGSDSLRPAITGGPIGSCPGAVTLG